MAEFHANYGLYLIVILGMTVVGLGIYVAALRHRLEQSMKHYRNLTRGIEGQRLDEALERHMDEVRGVSVQLGNLSDRLAQAEESSARSLQRVGLVRFSPFDDTGGDQSFALALLDTRADGIIVSSLHGRAGTRIYAKPVRAGQSRYQLSDEEEQAVAQASLGGGGVPAGQPRPNRRQGGRRGRNADDSLDEVETGA